MKIKRTLIAAFLGVWVLSSTNAQALQLAWSDITNPTYRHGYFDFEEREFLGFGMVEQVDSEEFDTWLNSLGILQGQDWEWMPHYFVWEANRKIFLYPENWLDSTYSLEHLLINSHYYSFSYSSATSSEQDIYLFLPAPVPEPEAYAMLLAGLGLLSFTTRRRKQSAKSP
ncbi:MAG: PEP-CTERM sorting domain-containing protein [Gallionellaceae bacterium]|nr:PEP-CTERM sorting domain-containing protein [Gallionellaceae bacterium]